MWKAFGVLILILFLLLAGAVIFLKFFSPVGEFL